MPRGALDELGDLLALGQKVHATATHVRDRWAEVRERGGRAYQKTHGGIEADGTIVLGKFPDPRPGTTVLGRLVAIEYETTKTKGGRPEIFRHVFGEHENGSEDPARELPWLCFTYEERPSGLVIARGASRYTVTEHGIEG